MDYNNNIDIQSLQVRHRQGGAALLGRGATDREVILKPEISHNFLSLEATATRTSTIVQGVGGSDGGSVPALLPSPPDASSLLQSSRQPPRSPSSKTPPPPPRLPPTSPQRLPPSVREPPAKL